MRDPIDDLRARGDEGGPSVRASFGEELERELRTQHAMGRPVEPASAERDWRRPAIGWAVAGIVAVAGFFALRGATSGERVDTATSVTTSMTQLPTSEVDEPTTTDGAPIRTSTTDASIAEPPLTGATPAPSTADDSTPDTSISDPTTTAPSIVAPTTAAPTTETRPTSTPSTTASSTTDATREQTRLTLTIASRAGRDQLSWTVEGPTGEIAGFEIEWMQGEAGGTASLIRDPAVRAATVDRPADGAVGYRVVARDEAGELIAASETVRAN